jgi:hypothetical protein
MEDTGRVRLIIIGIILAIVAGGYFLFTQANRVFKSRTEGNQTTNQRNVAVSPSPSANSGYNIVVVSPSPTGFATASGTPAVAGRSTNIAQNSLPNTGFPEVLAGTFALSAVISGYFLRKYPR